MHDAENQTAHSRSFPALENVCSGAGREGGRGGSAGEIGADSRMPRPGELCQTGLQDTDTITGAIAVLLVFINSDARALARRAGQNQAHLLESHADVWRLRLKLSQRPKLAFPWILAEERRFAGIVLGV